MLREFSTPTMCHVSEWYFLYAVSSEFNQSVNNKPKTDQSTLCQDFWLKYSTPWTILELGQVVFTEISIVLEMSQKGKSCRLRKGVRTN